MVDDDQIKEEETEGEINPDLIEAAIGDDVVEEEVVASEVEEGGFGDDGEEKIEVSLDELAEEEAEVTDADKYDDVDNF
jgi:hypothetical protein